MAVSVLIVRENETTLSTAMNVKTMLADFLSFVTPNVCTKPGF